MKSNFQNLSLYIQQGSDNSVSRAWVRLHHNVCLSWFCRSVLSMLFVLDKQSDSKSKRNFLIRNAQHLSIWQDISGGPSSNGEKKNTLIRHKRGGGQVQDDVMQNYSRFLSPNMQIAEKLFTFTPANFYPLLFWFMLQNGKKIYIKKSKSTILSFKKICTCTYERNFKSFFYSSVLLKRVCASLHVCVRFLCPFLCRSATVHGSDKR